MARQRRHPLKVVEIDKSPLVPQMLEALADLTERVLAGETLALGFVEARREGVIAASRIGDEDGFRHQLVAGCHYLLADLTPADEE